MEEGSKKGVPLTLSLNISNAARRTSADVSRQRLMTEARVTLEMPMFWTAPRRTSLSGEMNGAQTR